MEQYNLVMLAVQKNRKILSRVTILIIHGALGEMIFHE